MPVDFSRTLDVINRGLADRLHVGAQLYVSLGGRVMADIAVGEARAGMPMTTDTLMLWLSAGKPLAAVAIAQLWERGRLELDDPVARYIPAFATHGKSAVSIRHVLTHTGGFRPAAANWSTDSWERIIHRICDAPLETGWAPGRKAGYHIASGWFVLGEIVRRVDGRAFEQYIRDEILLPLGMIDSWVGMSPEQYRGYGNRMGVMHVASHGQFHPQHWDSESFATMSRPGANARGPIRELGRFYEMVLARGRVLSARGGGNEGLSIITSQTVEAITARHRTRMFDSTFRHVIDWGLGFMVNSRLYGEYPYDFGPHASPRAFGHGGSRSSMGMADPEFGLVVAFVFNGMPAEPVHTERNDAMMAAIYEDLDLGAAHPAG